MLVLVDGDAEGAEWEKAGRGLAEVGDELLGVKGAGGGGWSGMRWVGMGCKNR